MRAAKADAMERRCERHRARGEWRRASEEKRAWGMVKKAVEVVLSIAYWVIAALLSMTAGCLVIALLPATGDVQFAGAMVFFAACFSGFILLRTCISPQRAHCLGGEAEDGGE